MATSTKKAHLSLCEFCKTHNALEYKYKTLVYDQAINIDPTNEEDWHSLTIGFALGCGCEPDLAQDFARHIRYHTNLG